MYSKAPLYRTILKLVSDTNDFGNQKLGLIEIEYGNIRPSTAAELGMTVSRSHLAALDTLIPVKVVVSRPVPLNKDKQLAPRFETIRNRYTKAMQYLTSKTKIRASQSSLSIYKFEAEFNFGVVDISSGMKRVESSKEAIRNLTIIGIDGASEYATVNLSPSDWSKQITDTYDTCGSKNKGP
ncbi:hypothetical protein ACHAPJ_006281 [Fusarium lateritium]